jgi:valyl-tRNA synthetase
LPLKQVIGRDGKMLELEFGTLPYTSVNPELANKNYKELQGLFINQARKKIVELLQLPNSSVDGKSAALVGEPKTVNHSVKFYEKGDRPLEYVPTRQWYIKILDHKEVLIEQGKKIKWHPEHMYTRYEHWVLGLNQDWCISRQRFFGVPFPVWYPLNANAEPDYANPIYAKPEQLPIDPLQTAPAGYTESQRGKANGFIGDPDVMDTWATSSLTPQISSHWGTNPERHKKLFPCDIRPQAHEIIRTWAFYTIVKAWMHENEIPWKHILISGWILDPDRKKMSKSVGNVVTPEDILLKYSSDAVRYWTARARLGTDTAYDESLFKIGGKLSNKLFNASRFVLMQLERVGIEANKLDTNLITSELDRAWVAKFKVVVEQATKHLHNFEYAQALQICEETFWDFCDFYLELVKVRSYSEVKSAERESACMTLLWSIKTFLRSFAPIMPFVTEEIWSYSFAQDQNDSIHKTKWASSDEVHNVELPSCPGAYEQACILISEIRAAKTNAQRSLKWRVENLLISASAESIAKIKSVLSDISQAGNLIDNAVKFTEANELENHLKVSVTLCANE